MKPFCSAHRKAPSGGAFLVLRGNDDDKGLSDLIGLGGEGGMEARMGGGWGRG